MISRLVLGSGQGRGAARRGATAGHGAVTAAARQSRLPKSEGRRTTNGKGRWFAARRQDRRRAGSGKAAVGADGRRVDRVAAAPYGTRTGTGGGSR